MRKVIPYIEKDVIFYEYIAIAADLIKSGKLGQSIDNWN